MIIDERTSLDADAGEATARALQCSLSRGMWPTTRDRIVASTSRFDRRFDWFQPRGFAVAIEQQDVVLSGSISHEAAIAKVEQHLHGQRGMTAPADPLCTRQPELP